MTTKRYIDNVFTDNADDLYRLKRGKRRKIRMRSSLSDYWTPPFKSDALFALDGTIITIGADKYFKDQSPNSRNFLITGYDFTTWTKGFPYKSAAVISAPAGDAVLIAADINNYLYDSSGDSNEIPVISLFQDIDYEHKIFCKHASQLLLPIFGIELYQPRVLEIVMYATVKSGADLTTCQTYFGVPVEDVATMAWLSPTGLDATGNGSKALPYRSIDKIKATVKVNVYLRTGDYSIAGAVSLTSASLVNFIGTGLTSFTLTQSAIGLDQSRPLVISHCIITGTGSNFGILSAESLIVNSCKLITTTTTEGSGIITTQNSSILLSINNCVWDGQLFGYATLPLVSLIGNYGILRFKNNSNARCSNTVLTYNKFIDGTNLELNVTAITFKFNDIFGITKIIPTISSEIFWNRFENNITTCFQCSQVADSAIEGIKIKYNKFYSTLSSMYMIFIGGQTSLDNESYVTEVGGVVFKGLEFIGNKLINSHVGAGSCHTLFLMGINYKCKYNYFETGNGYFIVLKATGEHYTTTDAHVSYNIMKSTGAMSQGIYGRGVYGLIVANNVILNSRADQSFAIDDNGLGEDNSMLVINNIVTLGGNTNSLSEGVNITSRNNSINKMGFALTTDIGANDFETFVVIDSNGLPAVRIDSGEELTGDNNIGLASDYDIPDAITYKNQDAEWQRGAIVL